MLLLSASLAHAHLPHVEIAALAASPEFAADGHAVAVVTLATPELVETDNFGLDWRWVASPLRAAAVVGAAWVGGGPWVLDEEGTLWMRDALGAWTSDDALTGSGATRLAASADAVAVATPDGVRLAAADDPHTWTTALEGVEATALAFAPDDPATLVVLAADGRVFRAAAGEAFEELPALPGTGYAVLELGGVAYAGTHDGVWYLGPDDRWVRAGQLPATPRGEHAGEVPFLAGTAEGALFAGTGQAMYRSGDGGQTFVDLSVGAEFEWGDRGGPPGIVSAWTGMAGGGPHTLFAGYDGLRADRAGAFQLARVFSVDFTRDLAVVGQGPRSLFATTYGGGVAWTGDGATWEGSGKGLAGEALFGLGVAPVGASGVAWLGDLEYGFAGDVTGSWTLPDVGLSQLFHLGSAGGALYLAGGPDDPGLSRSVDGLSWTRAPDVSGLIVDVVCAPGVPTELVAASNAPAGAFRSQDGGQTWAWLFDATDRVYALAYGPGRRLVLSSAAGVQLSDDDGATWRLASTAPPPLARVVRADDGTLFGADFTEQVWRSADGGEAWEAAGRQLEVPIAAMAVVTGPTGDPLLVLGTQRGVWWSSDLGDTLTQAPRRERFEDLQRTLTCAAASGPCERVSSADASGQLAWTLYSGDTLALRFDGDALEVDADAAARFEVYVDGALVADVGPRERVTGLGTRWKDVQLVVVDAPGTGVSVDAVDGYHAGAPIPWASSLGPELDLDPDQDLGADAAPQAPSPPSVAARGCRGRAAGCLPLVLGFLVRSRRRRTG